MLESLRIKVLELNMLGSLEFKVIELNVVELT